MKQLKKRLAALLLAGAMVLSLTACSTADPSLGSSSPAEESSSSQTGGTSGEAVLRIGTTGSLQDHIHVGDLILAAGACTDTNFLAHWKVTGFAPIAAPKLASRAMALAEQMGYTYYAGNVLTSDRFYMDDMEQLRRWRRMGVLGTEMETAALYATAAWCGKQALSILTVSDGMFIDEDSTPAQRETQFTRMMKLALAVAMELDA